ncbi:single-stranded-DNA-specific exonuclease RecJ [Desulfoluna spongiiphila]|uniref:Single-stranded-DNA-specific exonuclease RecJ n=1 Tax=Desulfoluna spongiiphila TaxID=419481 RepID=A0A1G5HBA9_9BACT|nr:single-stranded-DNA-specific exonuclease RecJ [Desulfoluna spongiiphila]SCY61007.1 single-stranded-DNA-specific exonuclease [Desulfoluna spongiiphila]
MHTDWTTTDIDDSRARELGTTLGVSPVTASLLMARGHETPESARAFLTPTLAGLRPPQRLFGMDTAVKRLVRAITEGEVIFICGDYDADGITSTALLVTFLRSAGAHVAWHLPHRVEDGYGFHASQVTDRAVPAQARVIVTVDCGSTSFEAVNAAKTCGIDVIITDHHTTGDTLPDALAVINPKQPACESGMENLAGVGVAFYLAAALRTALRDIGHWKKGGEPNLKALCDIVALGTVADIVPLTAENRILTRAGLEMINRDTRPGIASLLTAAKANKESVDSEDIAFRLAPRINAAGRMDHAQVGLDLMLAPSKAQAAPIATELCRLNSHRQETEARIFDEIVTYIEESPAMLDRKSLVLARNGWHPGVLGIVASRVVREYGKPAFVISVDERGIAKGSGRSIPGVDLYKALSATSDTLERFGGHRQAAGLQLRADRIVDFHRELESHLTETTTQEDYLTAIPADARLPLSEISPALIDELETLAPFGEGNREPLFIAEDIQVLSSTEVGRGHRRYILAAKGNPHLAKCMAIRFNHPGGPPEKRIARCLFSLRWNRWNGGKSPQMQIHDMET